MSIIQFNDLHVTLGKQHVLRGLDGSLGGQTIGLLGPNGAGKTTLVHTLLGFHKPSGGSASILGHDIRKESGQIRQLVGYMPERDAFISGMTGVHFLRLMGELSGLPSSQALERAHETMFYVGLGEARYRMMESFSLGMRQLVKLAQALLHGPKVLFLDEPTNGLDPPARRGMLRLIRDVAVNGKAHVIISSHILRDVEACCEEVAILKDGKLKAYCNLEAERKSNFNFIELDIKGDQKSFIERLQSLGCEVAAVNKRRLKAILPEEVDVFRVYAIADELDLQIRRFSHKHDSLEDIFFKAMEEV